MKEKNNNNLSTGVLAQFGRLFRDGAKIIRNGGSKKETAIRVAEGRPLSKIRSSSLKERQD